MYRLLNNKVECEVTINKSKFITWLYPVNNEQEAKDYISLARSSHPKAVHHTYAYIINQEYQNIENQSDDGEPSKTAGMPMLDILRYENLINVVAIVIRYYGGIKLGVGGLIRAYGGSVKSAVDQADIKEAILSQGYKITIDYSIASIIEYELKKYECYISKIDYENNVTIYFYTSNPDICDILINKSNNTSIIEMTDKMYL